MEGEAKARAAPELSREQRAQLGLQLEEAPVKEPRGEAGCKRARLSKRVFGAGLS